jgi:hypothetical protein
MNNYCEKPFKKILRKKKPRGVQDAKRLQSENIDEKI